MEMMFMASLEKRGEENRARTAKVTILERQGEWHVVWSESDEEGRAREHVWYEGGEWSAMNEAFRTGVQEKLKEGYNPIVAMPERKKWRYEPSARTLLLHYYAERHEQAELLDKLKAWRRTQSAKENIASYIVASNRLLQMLSAFLPHTVEELMQIPGFGESRASRYGEAILALTAGYERQTAFPLDWVEAGVDKTEFARWNEELSRQKEQARQEKHDKRVALLEGIAMGERAGVLAERLAIPRRDFIREIEQLDKDGYDIAPLLEAELADVEEAKQKQALDLFAALGDRYLRPIAEKLYPKEQLKAEEADRVYEWLRLLRLRARRTAAADAAESDGSQAMAG